MTYLSKRSMILVMFMILLSTFITGCSNTTYICYDGTKTKDADACPKYPLITVTEQKASKTADKYGIGYANGKNLKYTRVNAYVNKGDWFVDMLFSDRIRGVVYRTTVKIDGRTASVTCISGCEILGLKSINSTNNSNSTG